MHDGEVGTSVGLVDRLISSQFPRWSGFPVRPVRSVGTVNAIYRLGNEFCVRLPRVAEWDEDLHREYRWLPELSPHLTLRTPEPVAMGHPEGDYPFAWAVYRWLDGETYSDETVTDELLAATGLAGFVSELRRIEVRGGEPRGGRQPLRKLDVDTRVAISRCGDFTDVDAAMDAWDEALDAPEWDGGSVWVHADLLRPNLLVRGGRLTSVIDFGAVGVGDPAADVIPAWSVFGRAGREKFLGLLGVEDGMRRRARGYALHQAAMIIPYYRYTNPDFVVQAVRTVTEVISDPDRY